jgi:hypothetical protein
LTREAVKNVAANDNYKNLKLNIFDRRVVRSLLALYAAATELIRDILLEINLVEYYEKAKLFFITSDSVNYFHGPIL